MSDLGGIGKLAEAGKELIKPVYEDLAQPAVRELGHNLEVVAKSVRIALAPLSALVWGYDQVAGWLEQRLSEKLEGVNPSKIRTPPPNVCGPAIEALRFTAGVHILREMYATLIATSMNSDANQTAHPAFVEIIKQLTSDEARLLRSFRQHSSFPALWIQVRALEPEPRGAYDPDLRHWSDLAEREQCDSPELVCEMISNLERLGIVRLDKDTRLSDDKEYEKLEQHLEISERVDELQERFPGRHVELVRGLMELTPLGELLIAACLDEAA
jgi:hypothetical protein